MKEVLTSAGVPPLGKPGNPTTMGRSAPKSPGGRGFKLEQNAKYGVEGVGGPEPTSMSRSTQKSSGGGGNSRPPNTATRGTQGVSGSGGSTYGVGGA